MDEFLPDYDPRNAPFFPMMPAAGPMPPPFIGGSAIGFGPRPLPFRPVARPVAAPTRTVAPYPYPTAYPVPVPYAVPQPAAGRRLLRADLSTGDILGALSLALVTLHALPAAPPEASDVNTNVVRQAQYLNALAGHFKTDARIAAIGQALRTLVG